MNQNTNNLKGGYETTPNLFGGRTDTKASELRALVAVMTLARNMFPHVKREEDVDGSIQFATYPDFEGQPDHGLQLLWGIKDGHIDFNPDVWQHYSCSEEVVDSYVAKAVEFKAKAQAILGGGQLVIRC